MTLDMHRLMDGMMERVNEMCVGADIKPSFVSPLCFD